MNKGKSLIRDILNDPFLLYGSPKLEYKVLHENILRYISFLRDKSNKGNVTSLEIEAWYVFREVKQNWLGFSLSGNGGSGLGKDFGETLASHLHKIFEDLYEEKISETSHLEKAGLFQIGVGKDNISDFTCNLIKSFLLEYTQEFAINNLQPHQIKLCTVPKAYFDYDIERWMPKQYTLPFYRDYIILSPRDLLTKDENWINGHDLRGEFWGICESIPNDLLRRDINSFYRSKLPAPTTIGKGRNKKEKGPTAKDKAIAKSLTFIQFPEILDYFIKLKEERKEKAKSIAEEKVEEVETVFQENVIKLINLLSKETAFYNYQIGSSFEEALKRINFLKNVIEDKDGYKLFYFKGKPIKREADLQVIYKLTWYSSPYDVNREVNNGRGPADYIVSFGAKDKTLIEFKLASNSKLKMNLANQTKIYEKASDTDKSIKAILYFDAGELTKINGILKELGLEKDPSIVLIDAGDNKPSASNVK